MEESEKKLSNMNCSVVKDLLPLYQDDALRDDSRMLVDEHLKECQDCRQYKTEMEQSKISPLEISADNTREIMNSSEEGEALRMKKIASRLRNRRRKIMLGIVAVLLFAFLLFTKILQSGLVSGISMEPTYQSGKNVIVNRLAYLIAAPKRSDVIFYKHDGAVYMKRIVGLPGDKVEIMNHELLINGNPVHIKHIDSYIENPGDVTFPIILGKNEYFVLGDNLKHSQDSRSKICGNISRDEIMGKVIGMSISIIKTTEYTYSDTKKELGR